MRAVFPPCVLSPTNIFLLVLYPCVLSRRPRLLSRPACRPRLVTPACRLITVGRREEIGRARVPPVLCRLCLRRECVPCSATYYLLPRVVFVLADRPV
ncbi:uncharacterized protein SCHCODRAFT_02641591 [Schizophyllum commune H4-8]|uniref:uncharacterized protein n=1 Tax=Schizophyllum commune (strain H4-8 / FGSC 9210) TaxID=578458 RepID=UPI00215F0B54|nr:uncharacterized protein SCHCODRAFT_02641591 [Schizophyllum commune H4-8]KAI5886379.1 hypothetical protein SCHCODRAFT_02641591 [Schizophyllum commune H4-8]